MYTYLKCLSFSQVWQLLPGCHFSSTDLSTLNGDFPVMSTFTLDVSIVPKVYYNLELSLEKAMAPHSSTLAWKIPWTEEPGRLQSMRLLRVRHDWATSLSRIGEGNGNPLQCSCLENPRDRGAWCAAVNGVTQSRTGLNRLSSSSSSSSSSTIIPTSQLHPPWLIILSKLQTLLFRHGRYTLSPSVSALT